MKVLCYAKGGELPREVSGALSGVGDRFEIFSTSKRDSFQREILFSDYDFVLIDFETFPDEVIGVLAWLRGIGKVTPVILLIGDSQKKDAIQFLEKGATDYVLKSDLQHVGVIVKRERREKNLKRQAARLNQLIRESESRYGSIVESSQDAIVVVEGGRIVFANTTASRLTGYTVDELLGMDFSKIFDSLSPQEYLLHQKGGDKRILEAQKGPIRWLNKEAELLMLRDITQRKKAENQLRTLFNFALEVNGVLKFEKLNKALLRHLTATLGRTSISLFLLRKGTGQFDLWTNRGNTGETLALKEIPRFLREAMESAEPVEVENAELGSIEGIPQSLLKKKKLLFVPIRYQNSLLGSIVLARKHKSSFEDDEIGLLRTVASELAVALENIHLFEDLKKALGDLEKSYQLTLETLVSALDYREHETQFHSIRVARYAVHLAEMVGLNANEIEYVYWGGLLHDIGKIGVPDSILLKPSKLNPEEWDKMKKHPEIGHKIIKTVKFLGPAKDVVLYHHERWDGKGYPKGLKGKKIPVYARIFAFADTLDAVTTDRPYRKARSFMEAREEILRHRKTQFDPEITDTFMKIPIDDWISIRREVLLNSTEKIHLTFKPKLSLQLQGPKKTNI